MELKFDGWQEAFRHCCDVGRAVTVTVAGHRVRVYPDGARLCAESRPYHKWYDGEFCDCHERKSAGTIATIRLPF